MLTTTLLACALAATPATPDAPWDGAPFQAAPEELLQAARALRTPEGASVDLLLEEHGFAFDADGRCVQTYRLVFRPLTRQAAADWGAFSMGWAPWHEDRPEIRARIIGPGGDVHTLDPSTISEAGADHPDSNVYTDRRVLRAPFPGMEAGAVVEELAITRERAPAFDAGTVFRLYPGTSQAPTRRIRIRVELPKGAPFTWRASGGLTGAPRESRTEDGRVLAWEWKDFDRQRRLERDAPPDVDAYPRLTFTTARSWQAVAAAYAAVVEAQLAGEDLAATARAVVDPGDTAEVAAQKLLDWISGRIRYTGLELNQASIVPARPSETLRRGFGDCKDLALLLAGLLRASGHPASLALLRTAWDEVDPEVPGMGQFDHAILFLPGARPLFVDATSSVTRVGELPPGDQGRLALVAAPDTRGLRKTPEASAADNAVEISREITLAEGGAGRAVQRVEMRGWAAAAGRAWRRHLAEDPAAMRKDDEERTLEILNARKYVGVTVEGLTGSATVAIRREASQSGWGVVGDQGADAIGSPAAALQYLPDVLLPDQGKKPDPSARAERRTPLWVNPTAVTLRYRITPPPGFHAAPLPAAERQTVGPLRYESEFAAAADGSVTGEHRVVLDARRIAPADAARIREWLAARLKDSGPAVRFRRTSAELLDAGKGLEALDELRRLGALQPAEPRYHNLLAGALLRLGMVDAARREARRSLALDPGNEWSHRVLAFALASDPVGRQLREGCDLAGAIAAQRRAVELKPEPSTRARLAFLLEHGARCERFAEGARLDEALAIYRTLHDGPAKAEHDPEYVEALVGAGRFAEARDLARPLPSGPARSAALLAAAAVEGAAALTGVTAELSPAERRGGIWLAWQTLARRRQYAEVALLLRTATAGLEISAEAQGEADVLARVRPHDERPPDPRDARALPRRLFRAIQADDPGRALRALVVQPVDDVTGLEAEVGRFARNFTSHWGVPDADLLDLVDSLLTVKVDGDPATGARVRLELPGGFTWTMIALTQDGSVRLASGWRRYSVLAGAARQRVDAGDAAGAARLLELVPVADLATDQEQALGSVVHTLWPHGAQATPDELRDVALALEAAGSRDAIPRLVALRAAAPEGARRRALSWALAAAYDHAKRWEDLLALASELLAADPTSAGAFWYRWYALGALGRDDVRRAAAESWYQAAPEEPAVLRFLAAVEMKAGDAVQAERHLHRIADAGKASATDYNNLAWVGMFLPEVPADAVALAQKAVSLTSERNRAYLHTLATLRAARGAPSEALQVLLKATEVAPKQVQPEDWLVLGLIAEQYGLPEDAIAAYGRVPKDANAMSAGALAAAGAARARAAMAGGAAP